MPLSEPAERDAIQTRTVEVSSYRIPFGGFGKWHTGLAPVLRRPVKGANPTSNVVKMILLSPRRAAG